MRIYKAGWLLAFALLFFAIPATAQEKTAKLSAEDVAKRMQDYYGKTTDFQAKFTQTYNDIAAGEAKLSYGRVYFKKPGKMRWDYYASKTSKKRDKIYVSDGNIFWIYETEFKQVFQQCLKESKLPTSLKFLMGEGDLLEDFDVTFDKKSSDKTPILKLVPKKPTPKYKELRFVLNPKDFQVERTIVMDPYGNTNTIVFSKAMVNRNLPDSGFKFSVPRGARLINPQKKCD